VIRPIEARDNETVKKVVQSVLTSFGANRPGFAFVDEELNSMYESYSQPGKSYYVLERDGAVVGGGGIVPLSNASDGYCELVKMYFLRSARGLGYGRKMIELCLADAKRMGYDTCYLETLETMETAQFLYKEYGFVPLDKPFGSTGHCGCDVYMMKTL